MRIRSILGMAAVIAVLASINFGCDEDVVEHPTGDEAWEMAHELSVDDDDVIARVNGNLISADDINELWSENPELSADEVLDLAIEQEVLAQEAKSQGFHQRPEVEFARKQGMVTALLRETVENVEPESRTRREQIFKRAMANSRTPEGLRASHLVVLVPREVEDENGEEKSLTEDEREPKFEEARTYIDDAITRLDGEVDDDALRRVAEELNEEILTDGFQAVVNVHMRFPRAGETFQSEFVPEGWTPVVEEFSEGAETVAGDDRRGELSEPVRTAHGWHLVRVDEVIEATFVDEDAAKEYAEHQLRTELHRNRYIENIEKWAEGVPLQVFPERLATDFDE